jgi:hypothetical protein
MSKFPVIIFFILCLTAVTYCAGGLLSDSLFIDGYYSQQGKTFERSELEFFLMEKDACAQKARKSRSFRYSANGIGAAIMCASLAITYFQARALIDAVKNQEPVGPHVDNMAIPLTIGGDLASFVQGQISTHSDYLLYKAVTAYNDQVQQSFYPETVIDKRITRVKSKWYRQGRLLMPINVLYPVLKEKPSSRSFASSSKVFKVLRDQAFTAGFMFFALSAFSYIEDDPSTIDQRKRQLGTGIALTSVGIINWIISGVTLKRAILEYNKGLEPVEEKGTEKK